TDRPRENIVGRFALAVIENDAPARGHRSLKDALSGKRLIDQRNVPPTGKQTPSLQRFQTESRSIGRASKRHEKLIPPISTAVTPIGGIGPFGRASYLGKG